MKIFSDIKSFIDNPKKFVRDKPKNVFYFSTILKIFSFISLIFKSLNPLYFVASSILLFSASLYFDYKILSNIDHLAFLSFQKNIKNNPHKCGYYSGRICATIVKTNFIDRAKGFYSGFKSELFS